MSDTTGQSQLSIRPSTSGLCHLIYEAVDNAVVLELGYNGYGVVGENHHVCPIHPEYAADVSHDTGGIPDVSTMPAPVRAIFESAFGDATGHIFLVALPFAVGALIAVLFIKEVPLRTSVKREDELMAEASRA